MTPDELGVFNAEMDRLQGKGWVECEECGGEGWLESEDWQDFGEDLLCPVCKGDGGWY